MHLTTRRAGLVSLVVAMLASPALGAPTKQKCIEAAEEGQQLRSEGKLQDAAEQFRVCAATECPKLLQKDCVVWLSEVTTTKPSVTVRAEDEDGVEVQDAHITMDDAEWAPTRGSSRPVSVGSHRFVWVREGQAAVEERVNLRDGETDRLIVLRAPKRAKPPPPKRESSSVSPWVWVGYGVGVGAASTGVGFYALGLGQRSTLEGLCAKSGTCLESDVSSSRGNLILGDVMVGVGIVALAASTYFLVRELTRGPAITDLDVATRPPGGGGALGLGFGPAWGPRTSRGATADGRSLGPVE